MKDLEEGKGTEGPTKEDIREMLKEENGKDPTD